MDNEIFYSKRKFRSEKEMYKAFQRYSVRTNNISRKVLGFKTPNEMVEEYLKGTYDATNNEYSSQGTLRFTP